MYNANMQAAFTGRMQMQETSDTLNYSVEVIFQDGRIIGLASLACVCAGILYLRLKGHYDG